MLSPTLRALFEAVALTTWKILRRDGKRHLLTWFCGAGEDVVVIVARADHAQAFRRLADILRTGGSEA